MFSQDLLTFLKVKRLRLPLLDLRDKAVLAANLCFLYHTMKASEHLLHVGVLTSVDVNLRDYYTKHLEEEEGHADWLLRDLTEGGVDSSTIPRQSMQMAGVQYYLMFHVNPASLLGYMAALECFPAPMELIEQLEALHGKPLLRTMRYHSEHDPKHAKDLLAFIDLRPQRDYAAIMEAAEQAIQCLTLASQQMEVAHAE